MLTSPASVRYSMNMKFARYMSHVVNQRHVAVFHSVRISVFAVRPWKLIKESHINPWKMRNCNFFRSRIPWIIDNSTEKRQSAALGNKSKCIESDLGGRSECTFIELASSRKQKKKFSQPWRNHAKAMNAEKKCTKLQWVNTFSSGNSSELSSHCRLESTLVSW